MKKTNFDGRRINTFSPLVGPTKPSHLPSMIVFDLDDCLWTPEMHELPGMPELPVHGVLREPTNSNGAALQGVVGLQVLRYKHATVRLHRGALQVLQELAINPEYEGIVLATASSSLEPSYSYACLEGLEVLPGLTLADMMSYNQIGRTGKLSPNKLTHFAQLREETDGAIPFENMLFFDDCNWGDHCTKVSRALGVVSQKTPRGLTLHEFREALEKYKRQAILCGDDTS